MKDHGAIKLFPDKEEPMFKDGDDGGGSDMLGQIVISEVDNGWIVTAEFMDEEGELTGSTSVFTTKEKDFNGNLAAINHIIDAMGLRGIVKALPSNK